MTVCLPNEPCIVNSEQQWRLTDEFLNGYLSYIENLFIAIRRQLDRYLRQAKPQKLGKPYPLGQCLEISQAFERLFKQLKPSSFNVPEHEIACQAIQDFLLAGGKFRQVWGDLRGEYFQNAFTLGSLYVDVANDTVDPNKPPVEILPFTEANLSPIKDFFHFKRIAERYWQAQVLPNLLVPSLAPYFPLIVLQPNSGPQLQGLFDYMIALTQRDLFQPSEEVLKQLAFPEALFIKACSWQEVAVQPFPMNKEQRRQAAIQTCQMAREKQDYKDRQCRDRAVQKALLVNQQWLNLRL